ncbi:MAG: hypothetical protein C4527_26155 [Candidatus Omnitrophota bacterium]|nr:MAG: hypothetical protein C4527_26155 [Candidatus Omnitrophota bacterium]
MGTLRGGIDHRSIQTGEKSDLVKRRSIHIHFRALIRLIRFPGIILAVETDIRIQQLAGRGIERQYSQRNLFVRYVSSRFRRTVIIPKNQVMPVSSQPHGRG